MYIYVAMTHSDSAYHHVRGPFDDLDSLVAHAEAELYEPSFPETKLKWSPDRMWANNEMEYEVTVHILPKK